MVKNSAVAHRGVVESVEANLVRVRFIAHSACSACHAKGVCSLSEVETKIVEVKYPDIEVQTGDTVDVSLERQHGMKAVLYGYVLPLVILMFTLIILYAITQNEAISAISSIAVLIPYYLLLYLMRDRISRVFKFRLTKIYQ